MPPREPYPLSELLMDIDVLRAKINGETAKMSWQELGRFFASGSVVHVSEKLDLVDCALAFTLDDKASVNQWMEKGLVALVSDAQALAWHEADASLWAVVVRPWILVQEPTQTADHTIN